MLDTNVAWEYLVMILDKFLGRTVPIRFIVFSLVGGFWVASAIAGILVGAVWNYAVTAVYTWKTR